MTNLQPTATAAGNYITDMSLRFYTAAVESDEQDLVFRRVDETEGLQWKISDTVRHYQETVANGAVANTLSLHNFNKTAYVTIFVYRPQANLAQQYVTGNNRFTFVAITDYKIDSAGEDFCRLLTDAECKNVIIRNYFPCTAGDNIYVYPHCYAPGDDKNTFGAINFGNITNPQLVTTHPALGAAHYLTAFQLTHEWVQAQGRWRAGNPVEMSRMFRN